MAKRSFEEVDCGGKMGEVGTAVEAVANGGVPNGDPRPAAPSASGAGAAASGICAATPIELTATPKSESTRARACGDTAPADAPPAFGRGSGETLTCVPERSERGGGGGGCVGGSSAALLLPPNSDEKASSLDVKAHMIELRRSF